jgi:copper chaperone
MKQRDTILNVTGMSCGSCVRHVTAALKAVPGVSEVNVQLRAGTVEVRHEDSASVSALAEAVREAGYELGVPADGERAARVI